MKTRDFFSPVRRRKYVFLIVGSILTVLTVFGIGLLPEIERVTHYYTVKAVDEAPAGNHYYSAEGSERAADAIAGWAKDGGFQNEILAEAGVDIPKFRTKITARKQNRFNVYYLVNFWPDDREHAQSVMDALQVVLADRVEKFNEGNTSKFVLTEVSVSGTMIEVPYSWGVVFALLFGFGVAFFGMYWFESVKNILSYEKQLFAIYGNDVPVLKIYSKLGSHDEAFLEQFVLTFASPRMIGVFDAAEKFFNLAPRDSIDEERDTPILVVKMGETKLHDLENLKAIFGDKVGIILFN